VGLSKDNSTPQERDLHHWRLLKEFRSCLDLGLRQERLHPSFSDPQRLLLAGDYLSLFLLGLFNPVIQTTRGLCEASRLKRVQEEVCGRSVSLGSFSEAQHLLEPQLLERVFGDLLSQLPSHSQDPQLGQWQWLAQDGSLFRALPRMHWALYGGGKAGAPNRAVRLHLSLNILEDKPQVVAIRPGKECERQVWAQHWKKGQAYVGDAYFGQDYRNFALLNLRGCAYVLRLAQKALIDVEQELPLSEADRQQQVVRQAWVRLGGPTHRSVRVRVVWIAAQDGSTLILVTNLAPEALSAAMVSLLYRKRWKVELFFRWIKCILKCQHWLAESYEGARLQIYLALIAGLLLQLYLGRRPTKRMMELLQMHQLGWATNQELIEGLARLQAQGVKRTKV
jgi:hypothetical protein